MARTTQFATKLPDRGTKLAIEAALRGGLLSFELLSDPDSISYLGGFYELRNDGYWGW